MQNALTIIAVSLVLANTAQATSPKSAIPWLSESVTLSPATLPPPEPASAAEPEGGIMVTSLVGPSPDAIGILSPAQSGLAREFWGQTSTLRVSSLIVSQPIGGVPEARAVFTRILLAEVDAPLGADMRPLVLLSRIDRLMQMGALDQAEALIQVEGISGPEVFRRAFDIGLLTGRTEKPCEMLGEMPTLSPTLPTRVFCLARADDWTAAALTLTAGHDLGEITQEQEETLARFLDPHLFEDMEEPPLPEPLTPLDFILRDAVALPRPDTPLPLAFLHVDLNELAPIRAQIEAGERLVKSGAIPSAVLFRAYRAGKPAASGGVWDRVQAVQDLDQALLSDNAMKIAGALEQVDVLFSDNGLRLPMAQEFAAQLAEISIDGFERETKQRLAQLLLLANMDEPAENWKTADDSPIQRLAFALAGDMTDLPTNDGLQAHERAIIAGLTGIAPPSDSAGEIAGLLDSNQAGEAILKALALLKDGLEVDPGDLSTALFVMRKAGLEQAARRIGLETLLLQTGA